MSKGCILPSGSISTLFTLAYLHKYWGVFATLRLPSYPIIALSTVVTHLGRQKWSNTEFQQRWRHGSPLDFRHRGVELRGNQDESRSICTRAVAAHHLTLYIVVSSLWPNIGGVGRHKWSWCWYVKLRIHTVQLFSQQRWLLPFLWLSLRLRDALMGHLTLVRCPHSSQDVCRSDLAKASKSLGLSSMRVTLSCPFFLAPWYEAWTVAAHLHYMTISAKTHCDHYFDRDLTDVSKGNSGYP